MQVPVSPTGPSFTDREALMAFFHSTAGASWNRNENWNTTAELSTWCGVEVNGEERVVKLCMRGNTLQGKHTRALTPYPSVDKCSCLTTFSISPEEFIYKEHMVMKKNSIRESSMAGISMSITFSPAHISLLVLPCPSCSPRLQSCSQNRIVVRF